MIWVVHWLTLFVDVNNKFILFFNSTGDEPTQEIRKLIERIQKQANSINLDLKYLENKKNHQRRIQNVVYIVYTVFPNY